MTNEAREKLNLIRPDNIKEAMGVKGVTPAHIVAILNYLNRL
jgi:tRNA U34 5-carboxymethylaminomethyl modifying enzyme MnmG/GidA